MTEICPQDLMSCEAEVLPPSVIARDGWTPHLVVLCHGILTGETEPDWSDAGGEWLREQSARYSVITAEYFGLPLPRVQALSNRKEARSLIRRATARARELYGMFGVLPRISLAGHSNGGILIDQVAEGLIERGWKLHGMLFMASANRAKRQTQRCAQWMAEGSLEKAAVVIAGRDRVIGFLRWDPVRVVAWPWGALGREGWAVDEIPAAVADRFAEEVVDSNHGDFLDHENRLATFENILGPFVGWSEEQEGRAA